MWVEQVKTGYKYIERYTDPMTGKYKRVSIVLKKNTAQAKKQAQEALSKKIEHALNMYPAQKDMTLSRLINLYREEQKNTIKASTYERNYYACESIKKILGEDTLLKNLNAGYIRSAFLSTGEKPGRLNERMIRLKALLRWGYRNDYLESISFLDKLERFNDVPHRVKIEDKFLEAEELRLLLEHMKIKKWRILTEFLALTGLRFGEAAALLRSDINLKERVIHVTKTYDQIHDIVTTPKTGCSVRDISIQDELLPVCKIVLANSMCENIIHISNILFPGTAREHMQFDCYAKYLREQSEKAIGRRITPHTLRHTHASLLMEQGIDIDTISRRLGHSDSRITREIYLHVTKKLKERENEKLRDIKIL